MEIHVQRKVLQEALDMFNKLGFAKGVYLKDKYGVTHNRKRVTACCAKGALALALDIPTTDFDSARYNQLYKRLEKAAYQVIREQTKPVELYGHAFPIAFVNDKLGKPAVVRMYELAINSCAEGA